MKTITIDFSDITLTEWLNLIIGPVAVAIQIMYVGRMFSTGEIAPNIIGFLLAVNGPLTIACYIKLFMCIQIKDY